MMLVELLQSVRDSRLVKLHKPLAAKVDEAIGMARGQLERISELSAALDDTKEECYRHEEKIRELRTELNEREEDIARLKMTTPETAANLRKRIQELTDRLTAGGG